MRKIFLAIVLLSFAGCASEQSCLITTGNDDTIVTENGRRVGAGHVAHLTLNAGSDHVVSVSAPGCAPHDVTFTSHVSIEWTRLIVPLFLCPPVLALVPVLAVAGFYDTLEPRATFVVLRPQ